MCGDARRMEVSPECVFFVSVVILSGVIKEIEWRKMKRKVNKDEEMVLMVARRACGGGHREVKE